MFCWSWMGKPSDPRLRLGCCNRHPRLHERCWIVAVARGAEKKYRKFHLLHRVNGMVRLVSGTTILHCYICTLYIFQVSCICFTIKMTKMVKPFCFFFWKVIFIGFFKFSARSDFLPKRRVIIFYSKYIHQQSICIYWFFYKFLKKSFWTFINSSVAAFFLLWQLRWAGSYYLQCSLCLIRCSRSSPGTSIALNSC